jgi:hypothetical protein
LLQIVLKVTSGPHEGREFSFDSHDNFIVGRAKSAQFRLSTKDKYFSRNHFLVEVNPPLCRLLDLNSTNGTFVNGKKVASVELKDGDTIKGGDTTLQVRLVSAVADVGSQVSAPTSSEDDRLARVPQVVSDQTIVPRNWSRKSSGNQLTPQDSALSPGQQKDISATIVPRVKATSLKEPAVHSPVPLSPVPGVSVSAEDRARIAANPQPFDGYEIIQELGRGGMGVVYRARSKADGSLVALKVVLPAVASSPDDLARFVREASIVKKLSHPNIVQFRDLGHANGQLFFAMDLVPGVNGQAFLRQHDGPLPVARAVKIVCQLLQGLEAAHSAGFVHRDVKPSNLLIDQRASGDFVWLADFGLARAYQASKISGLTTTGNIGGTLPYMAPEQITNYRDVTPAADQYSAAATLYYLLTRSHPYDFPKELAKQLLMVLQEPPLPIQQICPDLSDDLAAVIHKALSRLPLQRFSDVSEFRTELLRFAA